MTKRILLRALENDVEFSGPFTLRPNGVGVTHFRCDPHQIPLIQSAEITQTLRCRLGSDWREPLRPDGINVGDDSESRNPGGLVRESPMPSSMTGGEPWQRAALLVLTSRRGS